MSSSYLEELYTYDLDSQTRTRTCFRKAVQMCILEEYSLDAPRTERLLQRARFVEDTM